MELHPSSSHLMLIPTQNIHAKTKNGNSKQTQCKNGHEFDEINTYISPKSRKRVCRACELVRKRAKQTLPETKEYFRLRMRDWRAKNPERNRKTYNDRRREKKEWLDNQKLSGCSNCHEKDPVCIDFHHSDPSFKEANLSVAVAHWSIERLQTEIAKCILLCSNCHRKHHARERVLEVQQLDSISM